MSDISEEVRTGMYTALNVASVVGTGKATAVYYKRAPETASTPYLIYDRVAPGPVSFTVFGPTNILESDLWQVKAVTEQANSTTKGPVELAQDILSLAEAALDSLALATKVLDFNKRVSDIPGMIELVNDRYIHSEGFNYSVKASNA